MEYIGQKTICDTPRADGHVFFEKDYFEFRPRDARLADTVKRINYDDIVNMEYYRGIKKTVVVVLRDGTRHSFYMYKGNTFMALVQAGRDRNVVVSDAEPVRETPKREMSSQDIEKLTKLNELHTSGVITDEEFETQKELIMNKYR